MFVNIFIMEIKCALLLKKFKKKKKIITTTAD